ncbi:hypothetical protein K457DRAFT_1148184 [Linnemannia elongata AG-77]|uniref:Uncharacterized protein n=1 Tax=Linnemannia elongata AG-77 TaxID=1314771 RepID=A0A197JDH9_9FUNG|nr:hypothetical protein K457DRAFT_1148184 [Linnemannia elongata AG-77]
MSHPFRTSTFPIFCIFIKNFSQHTFIGMVSQHSFGQHCFMRRRDSSMFRISYNGTWQNIIKKRN